MQEEWNKITPQTIRKVFDSWKRRCRAIAKGDGGHIEQTKAIHNKHIKF